MQSLHQKDPAQSCTRGDDATSPPSRSSAVSNSSSPPSNPSWTLRRARDWLGNLITPVQPAVTSLQRLSRSNSEPQRRRRALLAKFEQMFSLPTVELQSLRALVFEGIPEAPGLRATCWRLLLGVLPLDPATWTHTSEALRTSYRGFVNDLIVNAEHARDMKHDSAVNGTKQQTGATASASSAVELIESRRINEVLPSETPLGCDADAAWIEVFQDTKLRDEIEKDVQRTHAGMHFFSQPIDYLMNAPVRWVSEENILIDPTKRNGERHSDVIQRILFIYAKLNPGVRYGEEFLYVWLLGSRELNSERVVLVQGMNELLAPLYYVVANDPDPLSRYFAEADAFFCFTHLLGEVKDQFLPSLDGAISGMEGNIERLYRLLARADPELCLHLDTQRVDPRFYAIRWLTLLMTQEFQLPDLLRLWDSLFADPKRFELLAYFCCALLVSMRAQLLKRTYSEIIQLLQETHRDGDYLPQLIRLAIKLRNQHEPASPT